MTTRAPAVRAAVFRHTSSIGLREHPVGKHALDREMTSVEVDGQVVAVKLARHDGVLVNAMPEFDDVVRAAESLGRPVNEVLADARRLRAETQRPVIILLAHRLDAAAPAPATTVTEGYNWTFSTTPAQVAEFLSATRRLASFTAAHRVTPC